MCCSVSVSSSGLAWMRKFIYTNTETDDHKNKKSILSYTFLLLFFNLDREKSCKGREWNQANNERIFVLLTWTNFKVLFSFFCVEQMRLSKMQTDARNGLDRLLIYFLWKTSHRILVIDRFIMCHSNLIKVNKKFFFVWFRIWF